MKKSYIKISILMLCTFLLLFIDSVYFKVGNRLSLSIILLLFLGIIKFLVGFEKKKYRYTKQIFFEMTISLFIFFILYYILGIIVGFYKAGNYYNLYSFVEFFLPIIIYVVIKEITRYYLSSKLSENKLLIAFSCILFMMFDITLVLLSNTITESKELFIITAKFILPIITQNILCTYISIHYGYKIPIYYMIVMMLYEYLLPIIPNPSEYLYSVIFFLTPVIILYRIMVFTKKTKEEKLQSRVVAKQSIYYLPATIIIIIFIYFVSGYFRFYSIAIASGSMTPFIYKGDVVIVDKKEKIENLKKGDIIAFKHDKKIIVHRINSILQDKEEYLLYTKGDANDNIDEYKVTNDMIIGVVKIKIPFIGYPTIWLNEIWSS